MPYQNKLNEEWQKIVYTDKYKYYNFSNYWGYTIDLATDSWNRLQFVSVDKNDNVIGYFCAYLERSMNKVTGIAAMNFRNVNITFSKDFYKFLTDLFEVHKFHKIEWQVAIGNPAEKIYDKIIKKYGGNIVGIEHESTKFDDGKYYDVKEYEIMKSDYDKHKNIT